MLACPAFFMELRKGLVMELALLALSFVGGETVIPDKTVNVQCEGGVCSMPVRRAVSKVIPGQRIFHRPSVQMPLRPANHTKCHRFTRKVRLFRGRILRFRR